MPRPKLTREDLIQGLNLLGELAAKEGVILEVCLFGGSAMMLAYSNRPFTKDIDAIIRPAEIGSRLMAQAGADLGYGVEWFDSGIRQFQSDQGTFTPLRVDELQEPARQHLRLTRASASYLLAMKCMACRPSLPGYAGDRGDIAFLIKKMGIKSVAEVEAHVDRFYPYDGLSPQAREVVAAILAGEAKS